MVNYTSLAATAERLISTNGRDVTLRKEDRTPADANKPWRGDTSNDIDVVVQAVIIPAEFEDEDQGLVRRGELTALVSATDAGVNELETFDFLIDGSDVYKIDKVNEIAPGPIIVMYELMLSK